MISTQIQTPKGYEIDTDKSDLKTGLICFKKIEKKYPQSVGKKGARL